MSKTKSKSAVILFGRWWDTNYAFNVVNIEQNVII